MAHPHHHHREHQVSHRRVHHILKGEPDGAKHHFHSHAFSKVTSKTAAEHHDGHVAGKKAPKRYARGGRTKHGAQTNIAIVVPGGNRSQAPLPGGPAGPAMPPPMAGPAPGPGGMPMPAPRARGGRTGHIDGESTEANIKSWGKRASKNSFARGGVTMKAGASTGVGRLEQFEHMKHKGR